LEPGGEARRERGEISSHNAKQGPRPKKMRSHFKRYGFVGCNPGEGGEKEGGGDIQE